MASRKKMTAEEREAYEERRREQCRQMGTLGGQKTAQTYGAQYMREIGKIGFDEYCRRHHDGNRAAALSALRKMKDPNARVKQPGPYDTRVKRPQQGG